MTSSALLFTDRERSFDRLKATHNAIDDIALNELDLDILQNPIAGFACTGRR